MLRNKNYSKNLKKSLKITLIFFLLFVLFTSNIKAEENPKSNQPELINEQFSSSLKNKVELIYQRFIPCLIHLTNGLAVAIDKNYALTTGIVAEKSKNASLVALDSKLNIAVIKSNNEFINLKEFGFPSTQDEIFFLLTVYDEPVVLVVKGKQKDNIIEISGNYPNGSLLVSTNLTPLGIIVKSDTTSKALLIKTASSDINKLIYKNPGWLGIQGQTLTPDLSKILMVSEGVVVTNIYEKGPSDKAGIKRGDVIVEADGFKIKELKDLQNILSTKFAGESLKLKVVRDAIQKDFSVILEEPPESTGKIISFLPGLKGVEVSEIPESFKSRKSLNGVFVKKVNEDSPALGILKEGDVIVEINKRTIANVKEFNEITSKFSQNDMLILVYRQDSYQYVIIPQQKSR